MPVHRVCEGSFSCLESGCPYVANNKCNEDVKDKPCRVIPQAAKWWWRGILPEQKRSPLKARYAYIPGLRPMWCMQPIELCLLSMLTTPSPAGPKEKESPAITISKMPSTVRSPQNFKPIVEHPNLPGKTPKIAMICLGKIGIKNYFNRGKHVTCLFLSWIPPRVHTQI